MKHFLDILQQDYLKKQHKGFKVGDAVKVYTRVKEGERERIQIFAGIVIARRGYRLSETFTVRRIAFGEGVEKVFPICSPNIQKVEVDKESLPTRAKLYYLRKRVGKEATKVKERRFSERS